MDTGSAQQAEEKVFRRCNRKELFGHFTIGWEVHIMKRKKRLVAILLALTLVFQMSAFSATSVFAEGEEITPAATEQQLDLAAPAEDSSEPAPEAIPAE